jgi:hypothetical protein
MKLQRYITTMLKKRKNGVLHRKSSNHLLEKQVLSSQLAGFWGPYWFFPPSLSKLPNLLKFGCLPVLMETPHPSLAHLDVGFQGAFAVP